MKSRARRRPTARPTWLMLAASAWILGGMACSSDDTTTPGTGGSVGTGGSTGTGGTVGTGGARPDASTGGGTGTGGSATGGAAGTGGGTGGSTGTGGVRADAAPDAAPEAATDAPSSSCPFDAGDGSPDCCTDLDQDGVPDCVDVCPTDPLKTTSAGLCGCGFLETDTDGDGTPDCNDGCPQDRTRLAPGPCGCGVPDNRPLCLAHRYSFNDRLLADAGAGDGGGDGGNVVVEAGEGGVLGTIVVADSVGGADGIAMGVGLTGTGSVHLAGGQSNQFIQLPAGIISAVGDNATLEVWVTWDGVGGAWQRIFDFGTSDMGPGIQGTGQAWVFLTPLSGAGFLDISSNTAFGGVNEAPALTFLPSNVREQLVAVYDTASGDASAASLTLYLNGAVTSRTTLTDRLSTLRDVNNWLGKSQFIADPEFAGTYHEFRIYSTARTAAQVLASFNAGPDALPAQ